MAGWAILLLVVAIVIGGVGLFVEALRWLIIIGLILLAVSLFTGRRSTV